MSCEKIMIIEPGGGLGNRLLTISSAYNLAKDCGIIDIRLLWRNNNECGCDFEDVLDKLPIPTKIRTLHFGKESYKELIKRCNLGGILHKFFQMLFYKVFRRWSSIVQLETYQDMPIEEKQSLKNVVLCSKSKYVYIEAYYSFYGELDLSGVSFNKDVVRKYEEYKGKLGTYDAMHIRRTDNVVAIEKSPTKLFYDKIDELINKDTDTSGTVYNNPGSGISKKKIYIATDDSDILVDLKNRYPENIVSEANSGVSRTSSEGMQFALYEMLILSGADTLYASYGSTFTVIAHVISGNRLEVLSK